MTASPTIAAPTVSVFQPNHETFDQFSIHGAFDRYVFLLVQASLPTEFWKPMFDLASLYSPIVIATQRPHCGTKDHDMRRMALYQATPRYDLPKLLSLIEEDEAGWWIDGDALISGTRTEISEEDLIDVAEDHCRLPDADLDAEPLSTNSEQASDQVTHRPSFSWKSALIGGVGLLLGLSMGLAF